MVMPPLTASEQGFALPLALTTSSFLLLSSLSLQTLALNGQQRGRHHWQIASRIDAIRSAAMDFSKRSRAEQACLLAWPSDRWSQLDGCDAADPHRLLSGEVDGQRWSLKDWRPTGANGQLVLSSPDFGEATVLLQVSQGGAWLGGEG